MLIDMCLSYRNQAYNGNHDRACETELCDIAFVDTWSVGNAVAPPIQDLAGDDRGVWRVVVGRGNMGMVAQEQLAIDP